VVLGIARPAGEAGARKMKNRLLLGLLILAVLATILFAGRFLIVNEDISPAEAIVVIGGDHKPQRMEQAVDLFNQGYAPVLIISAGTSVLEGSETLPEAEVMRRQALALGLSDDFLIIENESRTTMENAIFTKTLLENEGIESIILVTSAYHSRRARRIFHDVFGEKFHVSTQPAQTVNHPLFWLFTPDERQVVLYEYKNWFGYWIKALIVKNNP
jgi:uncharacterized SAM-binding protein YcdF (DUF218 family)